MKILKLTTRVFEVRFHSSDERLIHAARCDKIDGLEANRNLKRKKKEGKLQD